VQQERAELIANPERAVRRHHERLRVEIAAGQPSLGRVFADDAELANALYRALHAHVPAGSTLCLDVPEGNLAAVALAERNRLTVSFETARMYAGGAPVLPLRRLFGVTTFELG
jgi:hypothetical protein